MTTLSIQLVDTDYKRLKQAAKKSGKTIQALIYKWIARLPEVDESYDVAQDPVFQMAGYSSEAPPDLAVNLIDYVSKKIPLDNLIIFCYIKKVCGNDSVTFICFDITGLTNLWQL